MPSVDHDGTDSSMYSSSPPGPPPPGRAVDSPDRRGTSHGGPYGYIPGGYGGPPVGGPPPPPSAYYPMGPPPPIPEKSGSMFYGQQYPPQYHHPQSYPGYGNPPTTGPYMAYGYTGAPPPTWMSYEGGNGGGPPPQGFYPSQRMMTNENIPTPSRSSGGNAINSAASQQQSYAIHDADSGKEGGKELHPLPSSSQEAQQQPLPNLKHIHTAEELDRLKAAAVVELGLSEVKPIQSDFHFFVKDNNHKLLSLAIAEVDKKLEGKSVELIRKHRTFLIHSNLNCRIMKAWEDLPRPEREEYFKAEEDDRQRFMEEDEVVSRHCFTLTARIRSPSKSKSPCGEMEEADGNDADVDADEPGQEASGIGEGDSRDDGDNDDDDRNESLTGVEAIDVAPVGKRLPDDTTVTEESPAKKNKADDNETLAIPVVQLPDEPDTSREVIEEERKAHNNDKGDI